MSSNPGRSSLVGALVAALLGLLPGCANLQDAWFPPGIAEHYARGGTHGPRCPAITEAASIPYADVRAARLREIASTPHLLEHEQALIVDALAEVDGFSEDNASVLVALIENPAFTKVARARLERRRRHIQMLPAHSARVTVALDALGD